MNGNKHPMHEPNIVNTKRNTFFTPDQHKIMKYTYSCSACEKCPDYEKCANQEVSYTMTPIKHNMYNKMVQKRYQKIYALRFPSNECINEYMKRVNGVLHLMGSAKESCQNEIYFRNMTYNIFRRVTLIRLLTLKKNKSYIAAGFLHYSNSLIYCLSLHANFENTDFN